MSWADRLDAIEKDCRVEGWNSYHSPAVTDAAIRTARILCQSLDVVPMSNGGVQISMASEALAFEVSAEGIVDNIYADMKECAEQVAARILRAEK